jgi:phage virion morphogenesis protein
MAERTGIAGADRLNLVLDRMLEALSDRGQRRLIYTITRRLAAENRKRIAANVEPDGKPMEPRHKPNPKIAGSRKIRLRMFQKLKSAKFLKAKTYPGEGHVFFGGKGGAGIAKIHHCGIGYYSKRFKRYIPMPARPLLGLSDNDKSIVEDLILQKFSQCLD